MHAASLERRFRRAERTKIDGTPNGWFRKNPSNRATTVTKANRADKQIPMALTPMAPTPRATAPMNPAPTANKAGADQGFPRQCHVRSGADFQRAYRRRCVASDETIVVHGCENGLPHARLGLSVSRKVGNAVVRNRWKRLLREAFRLRRDALPAGVDLIVVPRQSIEPELASLLESLPKLARHAAKKLQRSPPGRPKGS